MKQSNCLCWYSPRMMMTAKVDAPSLYANADFLVDVGFEDGDFDSCEADD